MKTGNFLVLPGNLTALRARTLVSVLSNEGSEHEYDCTRLCAACRITVRGGMMEAMKSFPLVRIVLTWVCFVPMAFLNAMIREKVYRPVVGELRAHQIATALASSAFFSWAFFMLRKQIAYLDRTQLLLIGMSWVSMTMLFEFGFGHFIAKTPWKKLFHDYNLLKGRVWSLFLLTELLSPLLVKSLKNFR